MNNSKTLKVLGIIPDENGQEERTSSDGRKYKTVLMEENRNDGVLTTSKPRTKNIWKEGYDGSAGFTHYDKIKPGVVLEGSIETVKVDPFYIPSENGKSVDPKTGEVANKVDRYTAVVFADENINTLARSQGHTIAGEEPVKSMNEELDQELVEDKEELVAD